MTAQVSRCCGAPEVPERLGTCTRCQEHSGFDVECKRCYGEGHELSSPPGSYVLTELCQRCRGEGVDPGEDEAWGPW